MDIGSLLPAREMLRAIRSRIVPHGIILMYHRIAHEVNDPWDLCVSPANFDRHLAVLRDYAEIVPLAKLSDAVARGNRRRPPVAITFDDGYADNFHNARPILERHDAPATFFISTGYVGRNKEFWSDRLAHIVLDAEVIPEALMVEIGGKVLQMGTGGDRKELLNTLWRHMRPLAEEEQDRLLEQMQQALKVPERCDADRFPMTEDELSKLSQSELFTIGAHTRSHPQLTSRSPTEQMAEMVNSKKDCEAIVGRSVTEFAYPYGWYNAASIECAQRANFELACTTMPQAVTRRSNSFALPRFAAKNIGEAAFERCLALRFCSIVQGCRSPRS